MSSRLPDLAHVIRSAMDFRIGDINTVMPGQIQSYDANTQTATVRPMTKRVDKDPEGNVLVEQYPDLYEVPVVQPRNNDYFISFPLSSGDPVLLCSAKHDIESWYESGNLSEPETTRKHSISDCFAIVGGLARGDAEGTQTPSANGMVVGKADDDGQVFLSGDEISLGGEGSSDMAVLDSKLQIELGKIQAELTRLAALVVLHDTALQAHTHVAITPLIPLPGAPNITGPASAGTPPTIPHGYTANAYVPTPTNSTLVKVKK